MVEDLTGLDIANASLLDEASAAAEAVGLMSRVVKKGRRVVLIGVPGAFTPACHRNHLPGFVTQAEEIKAKGVEAIYVTAVNDVFVMDAWLKASGAQGPKVERSGAGVWSGQYRPSRR